MQNIIRSIHRLDNNIIKIIIKSMEVFIVFLVQPKNHNTRLSTQDKSIKMSSSS